MAFITALQHARTARMMKSALTPTVLVLTPKQWHALKMEMATYQPTVVTDGGLQFMGMQVLVVPEGAPVTAPPQEVLDIRCAKSWRAPAWQNVGWTGGGGTVFVTSYNTSAASTWGHVTVSGGGGGGGISNTGHIAYGGGGGSYHIAS